MAHLRLLKTDSDAFFARKAPARRVPFDFVLDALAEAGPETRPLFGCTAVYVGDRIVFVLRDKSSAPADNGVWIAMTPEHEVSVRRDLPTMRAIGVLGGRAAGWRVFRAADDGFEENVMRACELVVAGDPRIGKVPERKRKGAGKRKTRR